MTTEELNQMRTNILKGIEKSYNKLLVDTQKVNGELVISKNNKVLRVNARELQQVHLKL